VSDTPETHEALERWRQGKINMFDEMARMERERNEWRTCAASFAAAELPTSKENPEWQAEQKQWAINKFKTLTGASK
jgi:hypothetical protein